MSWAVEGVKDWKERNSIHITEGMMATQGVAGIQMSTVILRELLCGLSTLLTLKTSLQLSSSIHYSQPHISINSVYRKVPFPRVNPSQISLLLNPGLPHEKTHSFAQLSVDQKISPQNS